MFKGEDSLHSSVLAFSFILEHEGAGKRSFCREIPHNCLFISIKTKAIVTSFFPPQKLVAKSFSFFLSSSLFSPRDLDTLIDGEYLCMVNLMLDLDTLDQEKKFPGSKKLLPVFPYI